MFYNIAYLGLALRLRLLLALQDKEEKTNTWSASQASTGSLRTAFAIARSITYEYTANAHRPTTNCQQSIWHHNSKQCEATFKAHPRYKRCQCIPSDLHTWWQQASVSLLHRITPPPRIDKHGTLTALYMHEQMPMCAYIRIYLQYHIQV